MLANISWCQDGNTYYIKKSRKNKQLNEGVYSTVFVAPVYKKCNKSLFNNTFLCYSCNILIHRQVVVKLLTCAKFAGEIDNEIDLLSELEDAPHIINLLYWRQYNKLLLNSPSFIIVEFCEGGDLFNYYMQLDRIFTEDEVKIIMYQVILAIQECHERNIVHLDIKMENIGLMDKSCNNLRLMDFGSGRRFNANEEKKCGIQFSEFHISPHMQAPEILEACDMIREKDLIFIDYWELGVLMYLLLTKAYPFEGNQVKVIQRQIKLGKWKWPESKVAISAETKEFTEHLLSRRPHDRVHLNELDSSGNLKQHSHRIYDAELFHKVFGNIC